MKNSSNPLNAIGSYIAYRTNTKICCTPQKWLFCNKMSNKAARSKVIEIPQHNIEWALKPIFLCLWVLGIPLEMKSHQSHCKKLNVIWLWGLFLFCLNCGNNFYDLWELVAGMKLAKKTTKEWNRIINILSSIFSLVPVHFAWLAVTAPKCYNELFIILKQMDKEQVFQSDRCFIPRVRRISCFIVFIIVLVGLNIFFKNSLLGIKCLEILGW